MDDEADDSPLPPEETAAELVRETRGLVWIAMPALLGLVVGALIDVLLLQRSLLPDLWGEERTLWAMLADGGTVGLIVGGVIGILIWTFFPYKGVPSAAEGPDHPSEAE
jgi:hypothetical protein